MAIQAKVAEIYADLVLNTAKFKAAMQDAQNETRKFSAQMRSQMRDAQGATRVLTEEFGVHMPRALQSFLAKLPGVSRVMSAAFNAIAVIALIDIVVQAGERISEFVSKTQEAAQKNKQAWEGITTPLRIANDEMLVANDRLAQSILKLEHKPQNGLKMAIDEAVLSADKLSQKLTEDLNKIQETLKSSNVGISSQLFGSAGTDDIANKYADLQSRISIANTEGNAKIRSARDSGGDVAGAKAELDSKLSALYSEGAKFSQDVLTNALIAKKAQDDFAKGLYNHPASERTGFNSGNMDGRIQASSGLLDFFTGQLDAQRLGATNDSLTKQNDVLTKQQENIDATKKASAELLKTFETAYEQRKAQVGMSLSQEASFWSGKLSAFKVGSEQYLAVLTRFSTAAATEDKYLAGTLKDYRDRTGAVPAMQFKAPDSDTVAIAKGLEQQAAMNAAITEATTKYRLNIGAISEHDAATVMAAAHTDEYRSKLATLTAELAKLHAEEMDFNGQNVDPENAAKQQNVQNQIDELNGKRGIQQLTDTQATLSTTWQGMIDSVFDELIKKSKDTTGQLKTIASSLIDGLNSDIAKTLTGQKSNFRGTLRATGESLTKTGLGKLEGIGLSALGLGGGKRDGSSAGTALYVQMATPGGGIPGLSSVPGIGSLFGGKTPGGSPSAGTSGIASSATHGLLGMLNNSNWATSGWMGNLFGGGGLFGGGFALGGDVQAGVPINVGEMGIERFTPSVPGHITPNKDLRSQPVYNIDARGTDPVQTQMAVTRGMAATHARSVADASHVMAERSKRTPH